MQSEDRRREVAHLAAEATEQRDWDHDAHYNNFVTTVMPEDLPVVDGMSRIDRKAFVDNCLRTEVRCVVLVLSTDD